MQSYKLEYDGIKVTVQGSFVPGYAADMTDPGQPDSFEIATVHWTGASSAEIEAADFDVLAEMALSAYLEDVRYGDVL